jgi:hypothetical protein
MSALSSVKFRLGRFSRRCRRGLYRHIYIDRDRDPAASILVAGSARSGTTWLGDLLAEAAQARVVFEPFHHELVREFRPIGAFPYRRPSDSDPDLHGFCDRMLAGRLGGAWVDRGVERLLSRRRVVKAVRANLFLGWLTQNFPGVPTVLVVRHPCAVAASRIALGWSPQPDLDAILAQDRLMDDHLAPFRELIHGARSEEARNAVVWCVHHLIPLRQAGESNFTAVFYEDLCTEPEGELSRLMTAIGGELQQLAEGRTRRPSNTSRLGSAAVTGESRINSWQRTLKDAQIDEILEIVRGFGLESIYDESPMPRGNPFAR